MSRWSWLMVFLVAAAGQAADVTDFGAIADDGKDDRAAIQAAIDGSVHPNGRALGDLTFPAGVYDLSGPIFDGYDFVKYPHPRLIADFGPDSKTKRPGNRRQGVHLRGVGRAVLRYIGPRTDKYLVYYAANTSMNSPVLTDLRLECQNKCRGLFIYRQCYGSRILGLTVICSRQVGVDFVGCWGSSADSVTLSGCRGIGVRCWGWNTASGRTWKIGSNAYSHRNPAKQSEFRSYLATHTLAETRRYYRGDVIEDWPPVNETTIIDWDGEPVQTPNHHRAALVIAKSDQVLLQQTCLECLTQDTRPGITLAGPMHKLDGVRFEGNVCKGPKIRVLASQSKWPNRCVTIERVSVADPVNSPCVVEFDGEHHHGLVEAVYGYGQAVAMVVFKCLDGETHGNVVRRCSELLHRVGSVHFDLSGGGTQENNRVDGQVTSGPWTESK